MTVPQAIWSVLCRIFWFAAWRLVLGPWRRVCLNWVYRNWLIGKFIELRGDRATVGDLSFTLDNPCLRTAQKSPFFFGVYEANEVDSIRQHLPPDLPLIELGAGLGVTSCCANRKLRDPDRQLSIEANPRMIPTLEANRDLNGCRFKVRNAALGYGSREISFFISGRGFNWSSTLARGEEVRVEAVSLLELADSSCFRVFTVLCDIEGSECDMVAQEGATLRDRVHTLLMEIHPSVVGQERVDEMIGRLRELGLILIEQIGMQAVFQNQRLLPTEPSSPIATDTERAPH